MQNNTKTPVMILQELTVHRVLPSPEYNIIQVNVGPHEFEFHATVCIEFPNGEKIVANGKGQNKKAAKHNSAHNALNLLECKGVLPENSEAHSPTKETVNCIAKLRDICVEQKLPCPDFIFISDIGPPHSRQFTYECKLGSFITRATANSKKQAKQVAAEQMFEKIADILPQVVEEYNNKKCQFYEDSDNTAIKKYIELTSSNVKFNYSIPIVEMDEELVNLMKSKNLTPKDFELHFTNGTKENVCAILEKLELTHKVVIIQDQPATIGIQVDVDFPLSVLRNGESMEEATYRAYQKLHKDLIYFLSCV